MRRIICIGNRLVESDAIGPMVYDVLSAVPCPPDVEVVDGGLGGLRLLSLLEGCERVVFVDAVQGFGAPGTMVDLDPQAVMATAVGYDHAAGLPYLLGMAAVALDGPAPEVRILGIECGEGAGLGQLEVAAVARRALGLAVAPSAAVSSDGAQTRGAA